MRLALAFALVASAAAAQEEYVTFSGLRPCAEAAYGEGGCTPAGALQGLQVVSPSDFRSLMDAGLESFALATVLGQLRTGLESVVDGDCSAVYEASYAVSEIWVSWIEPRLEAVTERPEEFGVVDGFIDHTLDYFAIIEAEGCPA